MKKIQTKIIPLYLFLLSILFLCTSCSDESSQVKTIKIAMPYDCRIKDTDTNYYIGWLEEKTGFKIQVEFIPEGYTQEYLRLLFTAKDSNIDVVFFRSADGFLSSDLVNEYGMQGRILSLDKYIDTSQSNLHEIINTYEPYDLAQSLSASDGHIYFMPALDTSSVNRNAQTLWLNMDWLKELKMSVPQTTEQLITILQAFSDNDPNGNGLTDEVPLAGIFSEQAAFPCNFIINSFVYNDPYHSHMMVKDGKVYFAPVTDEWRQAMLYCRQLYTEGLLMPQCFTFSKEQLIQLANDPRDLIGGFTSSDITDVLLESCPELLSKFIHIVPLKGPEEINYSMVETVLPKPGGVILSTCKHPEDAYLLMDVMLSEEASLIGRYGEQGVDWDFAKPGILSTDGSPASIEVNNQTNKTHQNKHLLETGPFMTRAKYTDGVTWSGFQTVHEYINARAARSYRPYEPKEYIKIIIFNESDAAHLEEIQRQVDSYTNEMIVKFIIGEVDIENDKIWETYLQKYKELNIDALIEATQKSYDILSRR